MPAVPGIDAPHVFRMWTVPDMDRIHAHLETRSPRRRSSRAAASSGWRWPRRSSARGVATTVVELLPRLMSTMDPEFGGLIAARLEAHGVRVVTGTGVKAVHARAREVELADGGRVPADVVLFSVGRPPRAGPRPRRGPRHRRRRRPAGGRAPADLRSAHLGRGRHERDRAQGVGTDGADTPRGPGQPAGPDRGHERARRVDALRGRASARAS